MRQLALILFCFLFGVHISHAQIGAVQAPQIQTVPAYPEPYEEVRATLDAYTYDLGGASIEWFIDGIEDPSAENSNDFEFTVGNLGEPMNVSAKITLRTGQIITAVKQITPARIDVIIEADTTKPLHYKGRAMPSSGSTIRAIALPQVGTDIGRLSYKWSLNNRVLAGGPLLGNYDIEFEAPQSGRAVLSVEVLDPLGAPVTKKNIEIRVSEPELYFYEDNPLRGLSRNAIVDRYQLIGEEITVRAEPYFMARDIFESDPYIEWKVNGQTIENPSQDPQVVTLRHGGGTGSFRVSFHIRSLQNLLQGIRDEFVVTF